jgi:hypothetical protein
MYASLRVRHTRVWCRMSWHANLAGAPEQQYSDKDYIKMPKQQAGASWSSRW